MISIYAMPPAAPVPFALPVPPAGWPADLEQDVHRALETGSATAAAALAKVRALPAGLQGPELSLGIACTFTLAAQAPVLELALTTLPARVRLSLADPDTLEASLAAPDGWLAREQLDAVLVLARLEELAAGFLADAAEMPTSKRQEHIRAVVQRVHDLAAAQPHRRAPLLFATLPPVSAAGRGLADLSQDAGVARLRLAANTAILDLAASRADVHAFDFAGWVETVGAGHAFDRRMDLFARQPLATRALGSFALALRRAVGPLVRPAKKVLAVDLDNTLWGGTLGEDGLTGLAIGHEFPGNVYRRIQLACRALARQGVLLALVSKNDPGEVERAFAALPDMPLALCDFAARRIGWEPKHEGLSAVATELNISLDAFVFLDDSEHERAELAAILPEVTVLPVSGKPLEILAALEATELFDQHRVGREDLLRAQDAGNEAARRGLEHTLTSLADFRAALALRATIRRVDPGQLARAVQLLQKTNQFNLTTRRHGEAQLKAYLGDPRAAVLSLALADRFGDSGVVGLAIAVPDGEGARLDSFVVSCRALGRGAEDALFTSVARLCLRRGFTALSAEHIPTAKNGACRDAPGRWGMALVEERADGTRRFAMNLADAPAFPSWIHVTEDEW